MKRFIGTFSAVVGLVFAAQLASAQESGATVGRAEVSVFPGGGILFTENSSATDFTNYALGGSFTYNFNRFVGVEAESGGSFGVDQRLNVRTGSQSVRPPNTLAYNGNAVVYPTGNNHAFVPYATGGVGGLTMFERAAVGVNDTTTFLTGNVGGGAKYYFNNRWGVRGDYRFVTVRSKDDAPSFFGQDMRYGQARRSASSSCDATVRGGAVWADANEPTARRKTATATGFLMTRAPITLGRDERRPQHIQISRYRLHDASKPFSARRANDCQARPVSGSVGRNDPCPCGVGKKSKKRCIG